ncbi:hypothetical protein [Marinicella rhabdoformis]|uniref:hypothetical protein n=1 Tax=Marinicella rhabdoformis TaxID=2580566 RepID=UPI0012AEB64E|nr:hypothetical protein [Marinicella rhabdoformis]
MLEKLKKLIEDAQKKAALAAANSINTARFNHPLAEQTDWHPMKGGGANFATHYLDSSNPDFLTFKATKGAYVFSLIFAFFGLLGMGIPLAIFFTEGMEEWGLIFFAVAFGGIFLAVGLMAFHFMTMPRVFDTFYGCYYKGRKKPIHDFESESKHAITHLSDVKAIQVLRERVRGKNSSYYSYEINLVLHDASRINVIDHGKQETVCNDAQTLATTLGVPLWDAS